MKWLIPAKTFLLGEYAALAGGPAIILTTSPCFELTTTTKPGLDGIHPLSPAGRYWTAYGLRDSGLTWYDPYQGCGGMGASSAQFLGAYLASMSAQQQIVSQQAMLDAYFDYAWHGQGLRPSGYDVLAQALQGCSYICRQQRLCQSYDWPFPELAFILLHTNRKLATHEHLQATSLPNQIDELAAVVESAKTAFERADSERFIDAVNTYYQLLLRRNLVAEHSRHYIAIIKQQDDILAVKGCGALGADVLLVITAKSTLASVLDNLSTIGLAILATTDDLYTNNALIENIPAKTLEILS